MLLIALRALQTGGWPHGREARLDPIADAIIVDAVRAEIVTLVTCGYRRAGALGDPQPDGRGPGEPQTQYLVMTAPGLMAPYRSVKRLRGDFYQINKGKLDSRPARPSHNNFNHRL
jgi:hypothetical protein